MGTDCICYAWQMDDNGSSMRIRKEKFWEDYKEMYLRIDDSKQTA